MNEASQGQQQNGDPPALAVEGVRYAFGRHVAVEEVGFTLAPGSFTVLLGLNGAGKTTLFSLITRLYATRVGRIRIFGHDVARAPTRALDHLGVVFQQPTLDQDLTVAQSLRYHGALHGLSRRTISERAREELARIGLADRIGQKVGTLSGGERRRIEIARALLHRPRLLLLDEPTVGLDVDSRRALLQHVRRLCRDDGVAVLWATHLIDEIEPDDGLLVLHQGRLKASGTVARVCDEQAAADVAGAFQRLTAAAAA